MHRFNNDGGIGCACVSSMSRKVQVKKELIAKSTGVKPLVTVPFENGFHFYKAAGNYIGITTTNLNDFAAELQIVPLESITYHFQRKDFENWVKYTIKDAELAERISRIKGEQSTEDLRREILRTIETGTSFPLQ